MILRAFGKITILSSGLLSVGDTQDILGQKIPLSASLGRSKINSVDLFKTLLTQSGLFTISITQSLIAKGESLVRSLLIGLSLFSLLTNSSPKAHASEEWIEGMVFLVCGAGAMTTALYQSERLGALDTAFLLSTGMVGISAGCIKLCKEALGNPEVTDEGQDEERDLPETYCRIIPASAG